MPALRKMNFMSGRSTIPAKRAHSPHRQRGARARALYAGALLAAAGMPAFAAAQHNHAGGNNAPRYSVAPAPSPHYQSPHYQVPAQRGGYSLPQQRHFQSAPAPRPLSQTAPTRSPQEYGSRPAPRGTTPPAPSRPLITAHPFAPAPGLQGPSAPRTQYLPPPANLGPGNQQHLGGWLQSHSGQSFSSQEQSLRQEPGFSRLPQPQQQRLIDRLHQLDTMPPQRRERTLGRIENLERLSPERRQLVRNSAQELSAMPEERQQQLDSPAFHAQYNQHERQILGNLLSVEPYEPR